jgi:hypothetical protein
MKKTRSRKSRDTVPLSYLCVQVHTGVHQRLAAQRLRGRPARLQDRKPLTGGNKAMKELNNRKTRLGVVVEYMRGNQLERKDRIERG